MSTGFFAPTGKYVGFADMVAGYNDESDGLRGPTIECSLGLFQDGRGAESHDDHASRSGPVADSDIK